MTKLGPIGSENYFLKIEEKNILCSRERHLLIFYSQASVFDTEYVMNVRQFLFFYTLLVYCKLHEMEINEIVGASRCTQFVET